MPPEVRRPTSTSNYSPFGPHIYIYMWGRVAIPVMAWRLGLAIAPHVLFEEKEEGGGRQGLPPSLMEGMVAYPPQTDRVALHPVGEGKTSGVVHRLGE